MQNKPPVTGQVDLTPRAERRFEAEALRVGGRRAEVNLEQLHALMCSTVELLAEIDVAILPPVIRDSVPHG